MKVKFLKSTDNELKIEVEGEDTRLIPVTNFGSRVECPNDDTKYTLRIRWQNDGQEKREERKIEVKAVDEGDGGDGGGPGAPPTPGSFIVVTPILITSSQVLVPPPTATVVPGQTLPGGVLGTITELPETGSSAISRQLDPFYAATVIERFSPVRLIVMVAGLVGGLFLLGKQLKR